MSTKPRLFLALWLAGFVGAASILLIDFDALVAFLPVSPGTEPLRITFALKLLSLVQPAALVALATFAGVALAPKVGLSAPVFEAWAARRPIAPALRAQGLPGVLGGIVGGIAIVAIAALAQSHWPAEAAARISTFGQAVPLPTRLLYGGITEEVLLRWGVVTFLTWAVWRLLLKTKTPAPPICFHAAIVAAALIFGAGHLPVAFLVVPQPNFALVLFVIAANAAFGVVGGYLFWKRGLEAAILAHMTTHLVLFAASRAGLYF